MDKTRKFFKDAVFYSGSTFFSNILSFITGIIVRRILQPALMGLFNEIMLIFDYARFSHLGIIDALDKEMPYFYGKKDYKNLERLKNVGFSVCLIVILLISIGIFIFSFIIEGRSEKLLVNGIRIVSLMVIFRLASSLYIVLNRSRSRFSVITRHTILFASFDIIFKIFLVMKFGLYGLLWASVLTLIVGLTYFYRVSEEKFKFILNFTFTEVSRLFKIGFPVFIVSFVSMSLMNIDRIMIIKFLDLESLGFYTIALMLSVYMLQLPNLIYAVIFPRFYQAYGEKQNIFEIKELFVKPMLVFAYFFPILMGMIILVLPLLLKYMLPAYLPGLFPAYLLLLGSSFISLVNMPGYLLIALNKQIYMVIIGIFSIIVAIILNYVLIKIFHFGLRGIALGTATTHFLYTTVLIVCAFRNYTKEIVAHLRFFLRIYFPFFWVLMLLLMLQCVSFESPGTFFRDFTVVFCKSVVFLFSCLPLILYANKKTAVLTLLKKSYSRKA